MTETSSHFLISPFHHLPLFQCVPNFSEGRDTRTLERLKAAAGAHNAVLADFSADEDHNRCVATLVGDASGLEEAVMAMAAVAVECIDLRTHSGEHPCVGALDVLPFIPLAGATTAQADALARRVGHRIGKELGVPVYFYAHSASSPDRISLPAIRKGGLLGLAARMKDFPPDEGPAAPHYSAGVSVVGARDRLIAFNVNLDRDDIRTAKRIASRIREANGGLPGVRALGMSMASRGFSQVSVNITDPEVVTIADVYDAVLRLAGGWGVGVSGSEVIGCLLLSDVERARQQGYAGDIRPAQILETSLVWFMR